MVAVLAACHPTPTRSQAQKEHGSNIIGGSIDYGDSSVVALLAQNSAGNITLCTASLIASNVAVTAAHCVAPSTVGTDNVFVVAFGTDLSNVDGSIGVSEIHYDSNFDPNNPQGGNDIAVVIMQQAVNLQPIPYSHTPLSRAMVGNAVRIIGYGVDDGVNQTGAGLKRTVNTQFDDYNDQLILVGQLGRGSCEGDSGGPILMNIGGVEQIVGLTSFGSSDCTVPGDYDTRVDGFAAWLDRFTGYTTPQTPPPSQYPPVPPNNNPPPPPPGTTGGGTPPVPPGNDDYCDQNGGVETEPNNQPGQANTICQSGSIWSVIGASGDVDWFKGQIAAGKSYTITLSYLNADYTMSLYRGNDGQLVHIADATDNHDRQPQQITGRADIAGMYYLKVSGTNGAWDPNNPYLVTALVQ